MPAQLPSQALDRIPDRAVQIIGQQGAIETYSTVDFVGRSTNPDAIGPIVEVDGNSWIEANTWHFEEVSETPDRVELYDASRGTKLILDYNTNEISVIDSTGYLVYIYDITGVHYSMTPVIPDGWDV
jgi:hypothetical protein